MLWWDESDEAHGAHVLTRASASGLLVKPQITAKPLFAGAMKDTDQDVLRSQAAVITMMNKGRKGSLMSLVILKARSSSLFCMKDDLSQYETSLFCSGAKFPYSLIYSGPHKQEKEAETILSTLE